MKKNLKPERDQANFFDQVSQRFLSPSSFNCTLSFRATSIRQQPKFLSNEISRLLANNPEYSFHGAILSKPVTIPNSIVLGLTYHDKSQDQMKEYLNLYLPGYRASVPPENKRTQDILSEYNDHYGAKKFFHSMTISGMVVQGKQEARTLGYPTANIDYSSDQRIESGVWTCFVDLNGERYKGVAIVGMWALSNDLPSIEVHLLDFARDIYGLTLGVTFGERLRVLLSFEGIDELVQQIQQDIEKANYWFATHR